MDPFGIRMLAWFVREAGEAADSMLATGMEPSAEARKPAFAGPAGICAGIGLLAGGILGGAATLAVCSDLGTPRPSAIYAVIGFGILAGLLGAALGWTLRAFEESLWILPAFVAHLIGGSFGLGAGWLASLRTGVPRIEALVIGFVIGVVLATLFRVFQSRLP